MLLLVFQFHKGAIRTNKHRAFYKTNFYFNSIKVRLEQHSDCFSLIQTFISIP